VVARRVVNDGAFVVVRVIIILVVVAVIFVAEVDVGVG